MLATAGGALDRASFRTSIEWGFLVLFGVLLGTAGVLQSVGVDRWIADALVPITQAVGNPSALIMLLGVFVVVCRFVLPWIPATLLLSLVLVPAAPRLGLSPGSSALWSLWWRTRGCTAERLLSPHARCHQRRDAHRAPRHYGWRRPDSPGAPRLCREPPVLACARAPRTLRSGAGHEVIPEGNAPPPRCHFGIAAVPSGVSVLGFGRLHMS